MQSGVPILARVTLLSDRGYLAGEVSHCIRSFVRPVAASVGAPFLIDDGRSLRHRTKCVCILMNLRIVGPSFACIHFRIVMFPYAFLRL